MTNQDRARAILALLFDEYRIVLPEDAVNLVQAELEDAPPKAGEEIVRVLRLIEYEGPRELVEQQIERSMHGTRVFAPKPDGREVRITVVTLDCFPEVLELARQSPEPGLLKDLRDTIQKLEAQLKLAREGR